MNQLAVLCPLCEASFGTNSQDMLRRLLEDHVGEVHGMPAREALRARDPFRSSRRQ